MHKSIELKANIPEDITNINMASYQIEGENINGWAWSDEIGWVSLSCMNDFDGNGELNDTCDYVDYGLYIDGDHIKGCAWSQTIGYICFDNSGGAYALPDGVSITSSDFLNSLDSNISIDAGYASILGYEYLGGDEYKLGFPIEDTDEDNNNDSIEGCFNCSEKKICNINGDACDENDDCEDIEYCMHDDYICDNCLEYVYDENNNLINSYSGYECVGCSNINTAACINSSYEGYQGIELATCDSCTDYIYEIPGTIIDLNQDSNDMYNLCGFAWNGFDIDGDGSIDNGIGYLQFSPRITYDFNPYFSVEGGSIYAEDDIEGPGFARPGSYNASYLIKSGGNITNILSNLGPSGLMPNIIDGYGFLEGNDYSNTLGNIDFDGLITEAYSDANYNKYGSEIISAIGIVENVDNKVVYVVPEEIHIINEVKNFSGSGIIIIGGDLNIDANLNYYSDESSISNLNQISSLVWIVKGDVIISSGVTNIVGTFIILRDDSGSGGKFDTGSGDNKLTISGNVIAQEFDLQRGYTDGPAEYFINDGRIQANPPAGLIDFSKALPRFSNNIN